MILMIMIFGDSESLFRRGLIMTDIMALTANGKEHL